MNVTGDGLVLKRIVNSSRHVIGYVTAAVMPDVDQMHEEVGRMIDAALNDHDHDSANRTFAAAEYRAHQILEVDPDDADACYAIALTWYHRWLPQSERRKCVHWLHKTAELAPDHRWVPLYLGYQFWDDQQYADAFAEFARVDQDYFALLELHWRNIKTRELMLCCRVRGDFTNADGRLLQQLVSDYIAAEIVDRPIPLKSLRRSGSPSTANASTCTHVW